MNKCMNPLRQKSSSSFEGVTVIRRCTDRYIKKGARERNRNQYSVNSTEMCELNFLIFLSATSPILVSPDS